MYDRKKEPGYYSFSEEYAKKWSKTETNGRPFFNATLVVHRLSRWIGKEDKILVVPCEAGHTVRLLRKNGYHIW